MIIFSENFYSRHTPSGLSSYSFENQDPKTLTSSQKKALIEKAYETAEENLSQYQLNKALKYGAIGGIGAGTLAAMLSKEGRLGEALLGGLAGVAVGGSIGAVRGDHIGRKEGHDPEKRAERLARKYDNYVRSNKIKREADDYELYAKKHVRDESNLDLQRRQLDTQRQILLNNLLR